LVNLAHQLRVRLRLVSARPLRHCYLPALQNLSDRVP
jgi:hypothetical protein